MRIRRLQLAGLAVALVGIGAEDALADDLVISTATTAPVTTNPAANGTAGDITIASGGKITISAGQTAVTVNSVNDVTIATGGAIASNNADGTTGILLLPGNGGTITNSGSITLLEDYTLEDTDDDGDLDGTVALGSDRTGILLQAGGAFTGDIVNSSAITIEGNSSAGIQLDSQLIGNLTSTGSISITGDDSVAIAINGGAAGGVTGDVNVSGAVTAQGTNSVGLLVNGVIGGELRIGGTLSVTGFHSLTVPEDQSTLDPDDLMPGGSPVAVHYSVTDGMTITGIGVEDDLDDDGDGVDDEGADADPNDDATAAIASFGAAPAILIQADPSANLVLGPIASGQGAGFGLHVRGNVSAFGVFDGIDATAIRLEGSGAATVDASAGVAIDNVVQASASEADAFGLYVGDLVTAPTLRFRRLLTTSVNSDAAHVSQGVFIAPTATVSTIANTGVLQSLYFGETGDAVVIRDLSGGVSTINNSGTIEARVIATDDDPTDDIPPPPVTGSAIAIDVSASTTGVTLTQSPDAAFTDDDGDDDDATVRPDVKIIGDILFGSGNDTASFLAGDVVGDISFGNGADTLTVDGGAGYFGRITDSDNSLSINVQDGILSLEGGALNITTATFGADSLLGVRISTVPGETTFIQSSGSITFDPGALIAPVVPNGLPVSGSEIFLTATGGLNGAGNVTGPITGANAPFLYKLSIETPLGDPNSLQASYIMKTTTELGLTANQTTAFAHIIDALRLNDEASAAMASITTQFEFFDSYEDLMPSYASGATELAATAIQQMQGATSNRLAATRMHDLDEVSVWAQEIGYGLDRQPLTTNGQEFRGHGFGIATGIDGPLNNGALFGLSASFITSELEEPGRPEGEISAWFGQGNAYLGTALGPIDLDFIIGAGAGKLQSRRFVEIADTFSSLSEADWWAYEGHTAVRASVPMRFADWFILTPQTALTYVALGESGYTESGGGVIDYDVDDTVTQRLWGDAGLELAARFRLRGEAVVAPRIFAGYRANLIDEEAERTVRFVSGGSDFTLIDEPLGDGGPIFGIGVDATNGYSTFSLAYEGEFSDQIERHSLNAAIRFRF